MRQLVGTNRLAPAMQRRAPDARLPAALLLALLAASPAHALPPGPGPSPVTPAARHAPMPAHADAHGDTDAALGKVDIQANCAGPSPHAVNRGVALLHHMTYPRARDAFEGVVARDPACAMAHWGIAMTLFQPLWPTRPSPQDLQRGWDEVQQAAATAPATGRERGYVDAARAFFLEPAGKDYWVRIRRWADAQAALHAAHPDDPDAAALHALALLATAPANATSRDHADQAAAILQAVLAHHPDHPGAMHYLVHANDLPGRAGNAVEVTRRYEAMAPHNPHALHMPTHIHTRLGDWDAVISGNLRAAEAALEQPAGDHGQYVWDEFPHAIEYLVHAYLQQGDDVAAAAQVRRLHAVGNLEPSFKTAFHLASTQARSALERRDWAAAARIEPRTPARLDWDRFAWPEAVAVFAHGLGAAHLGQHDAARAAAARLAELEAGTRAGTEVLFARNVEVLRLELDAWIAQLGGDPARGLVLMQRAAELEAATPKHAVTPGPSPPAHELLGDLLLAQERPADALVAYEHSLTLYPKRFNSLLGAARAAQALGDHARAGRFASALLQFARRGTRPALAEARALQANATRPR